MYMSDNGPWMLFEQNAGSAGSLFGAKGTSYEGGVRVPAIFWGPGKVKPAVISGMGSTLDILPTIASFALIPLPVDREYDGYDLKPVLTSAARSPRTEMIYYHDEKIFAARKGDFKLYFYSNNPSGYPEKLEKLDSLTLFNLQHDPSERYNVASSYPDKISEIREMVRDHQSSVKPVDTQLDKRIAPATTDK
jgi:arylsulfatase A-like enzyme